jgi:hypothetical protein
VTIIEIETIQERLTAFQNRNRRFVAAAIVLDIQGEIFVQIPGTKIFRLALALSPLDVSPGAFLTLFPQCKTGAKGLARITEKLF